MNLGGQKTGHDLGLFNPEGHDTMIYTYFGLLIEFSIQLLSLLETRREYFYRKGGGKEHY